MWHAERQSFCKLRGYAIYTSISNAALSVAEIYLSSCCWLISWARSPKDSKSWGKCNRDRAVWLPLPKCQDDSAHHMKKVFFSKHNDCTLQRRSVNPVEPRIRHLYVWSSLVNLQSHAIFLQKLTWDAGNGKSMSCTHADLASSPGAPCVSIVPSEISAIAESRLLIFLSTCNFHLLYLMSRSRW